MKEKAGTLTDEERQERDKMKIWRKDRLHDFIKFKTNYSIVCYYYSQPHIKIINGSRHDNRLVEEIEHFHQILVLLRTHRRTLIHHHQIMLVVLMDSIHHPLNTTQKINEVFLNILVDDRVLQIGNLNKEVHNGHSHFQFKEVNTITHSRKRLSFFTVYRTLLMV